MANTYKHPHVEDYIEIIAGRRSANGNPKGSIFQLPESPISLARYDVKVVESFAEQCNNNVGFTDRQATLAIQLINKYERQLYKLGVDITPIKENPVFKNPIREIDRSSRVWVEDEQIKLRFPFNMELIELVKAEAKVSRGRMQWDPVNKIWVGDLTEYTANWFYAFARSQSFVVDPSLEQVMSCIEQVETQEYAIELRAKDRLVITNAHNSLTEYVEEKLGGFELDNLLPLVDNAPILGYTVEKIIEETVIEAYGTRFYSLCNNRELRVDPATAHNIVKDIVEYARATNRFPIYVYEPDLSGKLATAFNKFFVGQMMTLDNKVMDTDITGDIRVVYTTKIPKTDVGRIPLLVSSAGMLFGGDRQVWIQNAEKVVYFSNDVYNKTKDKGRHVCKLN